MRFSSRRRQNKWHELREFVWPSMGIRRLIRYYWLSLVRLRDTPSQITRGLVAGIVVCFTPLPITHIFQGMLIAWMIRGNVLAAMITSWVGNPWTYPFMWAIAYQAGHLLYDVMGWDMMAVPTSLSWGEFWDVLVNHPFDVMVPWVLGGYAVAIVVSPILFYAIRPLIVRAHYARAQARRRARIARRRAMGWQARLTLRGAGG